MITKSAGHGGLSNAVLLISFSSALQLSAATFQVELFATGISRPVFVTAPPGDTSRVFILEQHTGRVRIHNDRIYHTPTGGGHIMGTTRMT